MTLLKASSMCPCGAVTKWISMKSLQLFPWTRCSSMIDFPITPSNPPVVVMRYTFWIGTLAAAEPGAITPSHVLGQRCETCNAGPRHHCANQDEQRTVISQSLSPNERWWWKLRKDNCIIPKATGCICTCHVLWTHCFCLVHVSGASFKHSVAEEMSVVAECATASFNKMFRIIGRNLKERKCTRIMGCLLDL